MNTTMSKHRVSKTRAITAGIMVRVLGNSRVSKTRTIINRQAKVSLTSAEGKMAGEAIIVRGPGLISTLA